MLCNHRPLRPRRFVRSAWRPAATLGVLGAAAAAAVAVLTHPADAANAISVAESAVKCATTTACVSATNTSTGAGVSGTSAKGIGVTGTGSSGYGVLGISATGRAGVVGSTPSRNGVYGYTTASSGGSGVFGTSVNGYGVYGSTTSGNGIGVYGNNTGYGNGVEGSSKSGAGVAGFSYTGPALYATTYDAAGTGVLITSNGGYGLVSYSSGSSTTDAILGSNSRGVGGEFTSPTLALYAHSPDYPLVLANANKDVFIVDGSGNVSYSGALSSMARIKNGATVKSFTSKTTAPTVEDTGTAQLVGGAAAVRLDPTFAASIDPATAYRVFITPDGDTPHGLFVALKTASGFIVREAQGGRSTVNFDYRIVATALGQAGQRMAVTSDSALPSVPQSSPPTFRAEPPQPPIQP